MTSDRHARSAEDASERMKRGERRRLRTWIGTSRSTNAVPRRKSAAPTEVGTWTNRTGSNHERQSMRTTLQHQRLHRQNCPRLPRGRSISLYPNPAAASTMCAPSVKRSLRTSGSTRRKNGSGLTPFLCGTVHTTHPALRRPRETAKRHQDCHGGHQSRCWGSEKQAPQSRRPRPGICV